MNTPAHLLLGGALFGKRNTRLILAAMTGALLPDLSLYLLAGTSLYLLSIPPATVFGELYFSDAWQTIFAIDNSFLVWGGLLALAWWRGILWAQVLCLAALLHLACDFPLHHDDGRAHFWPLTNWIFESPLSYWDSRHHAAWVAPIEGMVAAFAALRLAATGHPIGIRLTALTLLLLELWVIRQWLTFF